MHRALLDVCDMMGWLPEMFATSFSTDGPILSVVFSAAPPSWDASLDYPTLSPNYVIRKRLSLKSAANLSSSRRRARLIEAVLKRSASARFTLGTRLRTEIRCVRFSSTRSRTRPRRYSSYSNGLLSRRALSYRRWFTKKPCMYGRKRLVPIRCPRPNFGTSSRATNLCLVVSDVSGVGPTTMSTSLQAAPHTNFKKRTYRMCW